VLYVRDCEVAVLEVVLCRMVRAMSCSIMLLLAATSLVPNQSTSLQSMHPRTSTQTSWHWLVSFIIWPCIVFLCIN